MKTISRRFISGPTIKRLKIFALLLITIILCSPGRTVAQADTLTTDSTKSETDTVNDILKQMEQDIQANNSASDSLLNPMPPAASAGILDDSTRTLYLESLQAYYGYRISGFEHRKRVFAWQLYSSKIIFWIVLLLVFSGICFSGIQFYKSMRRARGEALSDETESIATEFEATAGGVKVSSPVLGVIILVISLAFFYLYLVYVYPISEIF